MVEIRHKETNEQYSHITFDSILDTSCLKDTDGTMRKCLENIYNKSKDIFHYQDEELGTRSCKHLLCSLDDIKNGADGIDEKFTTEFPSSHAINKSLSGNTIRTNCCDCDNVLKFREFESDWKIFLDPWFQLFGYDEFTVELYSKLGFVKWNIFWDTSCATSTEDYHNGYRPKDRIEIDEPTHIDQDEFMWFKVGETFIDDGDKYGKGLIAVGIDQEPILFEGYSLLCPGGTWHGPSRGSRGVSMRVVIDDTFFDFKDWYSEEHKKLCEYVKSFTYKAKVIRGPNEIYQWSFVDFSEANLLPDWQSGGWLGKGYYKNIPKSLEPFILE